LDEPRESQEQADRQDGDWPAAAPADLLAGFLEEARQAAAGIAAALGAPDGCARIALLSHRLRGSAAMYGFPTMSRLAGAIEDTVAWSPPREGAPPPAPPAQVAQLAQGDSGEAGSLTSLTARQRRFLDEAAAALARALADVAAGRGDAAAALPLTAAAGAAGPDAVAPADMAAELRRFADANPDVLEYFGPEAEEHVETMAAALDAIARQGPAAEPVAALFRAAHTLKGAAYTVGCAPIARVAHDMEDRLAPVRAGAGWDDGAFPALAAGIEQLRQLLSAVNAAGAPRPALAAPFPPSQWVPAAAAHLPPAPSVAAVAAIPAMAAGGFRSSIRVSIDRIDRLMSLVGELVIARGRMDRRLERLAELEELAQSRGARMTRAVEEFGAQHLYPQLQAAVAGAAAGLPGAAAAAGGATTAELFAELEFDRYDDFNLLALRTAEIAADLGELHGDIARLTALVRDDASQLQRLVRDLRGGIGRARMVPIGQLFARFGRLVATTAAAAGKRVELELAGEAVEVDTAVAEAIADPLMHLVQNAVIHGIEPPEVRRSRGKPEQGLLLLTAHLQGRFVTVEVEDDGGGIDLDALRRRAAACGVGSPAALAALDREQALELVYVPGLSTSATVSQTAGRGVGMDVVRTNLTRLGGEIAIESEAGTGTRFTLKAPLTLLISEALFVRAGEETFAMPVTAVRRMLHAEAGEVAAAAGGGEELLPRAGGERLPLLRLDRLFRLPGRRAEPWLPVVVLAAGGRRCALAVDELLGVEEVVIKGLGELLEDLPLFSGAIVTAEGRVVLVLDAPAFTLGAVAMATAAATAAAPGASLAPGAPAPAPPPWEAAAAAAGPAPPAPAAGAGPGPPRARRLLLVDDSVSVRKAVGQMLGRHGYGVTAVADGEEALAALHQGSFDAVLTDLEMPRLNGYELIEEIRRRPGGGGLPIVVITTRAGGKHLDLARRLGATACFGKPFDAAELLSQLDDLWKGSAARARAAGAGAPAVPPAPADGGPAA